MSFTIGNQELSHLDQLCQSLESQFTALTKIVVMDHQEFDAMDDAARAYVLNSIKTGLGGAPVAWVEDPYFPLKMYLGSPAEFIQHGFEIRHPGDHEFPVIFRQPGHVQAPFERLTPYVNASNNANASSAASTDTAITVLTYGLANTNIYDQADTYVPGRIIADEFREIRSHYTVDEVWAFLN
ncbi:hypothetical protein UCREL1_6571 [Eutypa lata UCREL1]|uniref:Uncharacterized protein n=1 Tax=Eutypa lata (strain UCR-EL1) TaxID=1287681 RepID=M7SQE5_EUTLA|nr:hypothetical protein UCREL1_6571 [Eutypa lata UCREL1]